VVDSYKILLQNSKPMDGEEDIVTDIEQFLIKELQLLDVKLNAIDYDLTGMNGLYYKINCKLMSSFCNL